MNPAIFSLNQAGIFVTAVVDVVPRTDKALAVLDDTPPGPAFSSVLGNGEYDRTALVGPDGALGDGAQKYATSKNLLRYAVVLVVFAVLMLTHFADPLAAFAGLMGMKASAYLQPFIRGYKEKKRRRDDDEWYFAKWFG